jgi:hypothetical protein
LVTGDRLLCIDPIALVPIVVLLVVVAIGTWVYMDAKVQAEHGEPVVFTWGSLKVDTPAQWFVASLLVAVLFVPLYLAGRRQ